MKKILLVLVIGIISLVLFQLFTNKAIGSPADLVMFAPCGRPITYKTGTIDARFGLTDDQLQESILEAEKSWEQVTGSDLFSYDPQAELTVNLVYDRRQDLSNKIYNLKDQIEEDKNAIKPEIAEYERRSAAFRQRLANFNAQVDKWNDQGGAPPEEYEKLNEEQKALQLEADALNEQAKQLNRTSDEFSSKVGELNNTVQRFNSALSVRPEEGLYDPNTNTINIYFHTNKAEFVHTLAHELGHARGLGHVEDSSAIMHTQTNTQVSPSQSDIAALQEVCRKRSYAEVVVERAKVVYNFYTNRSAAQTTE